LTRFAGGIAPLMREKYPHAVSISAKTGEGIAPLLAELGTQLRPIREFLDLRVPQEKAAVIARIHAVGQVVESRYGGKNARFKVRIPPHLVEEFAPFVVDGTAGFIANYCFAKTNLRLASQRASALKFFRTQQRF
jgi:50S ribosomal subunit-associated GTPase HflX